MKWPGNSPDLNPIEELWKILGGKVMKTHPTSKHELIGSLIKVASWIRPWYREKVSWVNA